MTAPETSTPHPPGPPAGDPSPLRLGWQILRRRPLVLGLWCLVILVCLVQLGRLSVFMFDASRTEMSMIPSEDEIARHSCLTAYVLGAVLLDRGEPIYQPELYLTDEGNTDLGWDVLIFTQDFYQYPPQFLLLPKLFILFSEDFSLIRTTWYLFQLALTLLLLGWSIRWVGGEPGARMALWLPILFLSFAFGLWIQQGNIHFLVISASVMAMVAFEEDRPYLGAALLAATIVGKISPGLFGIVLLVQKRWKEAALTAGFGGLYTILVLAWGGWAPVGDFLGYQLPRLVNGEAFAYFAAQPWYAPASVSFTSLPIKLEALGVEGVAALSRPAGLLFTVGLLALTVLLARRIASDARPPRDEDNGDRLGKLQAWILLAGLASLQGSFVPASYGTLAAIWLLACLLAEVAEVDGAKRAAVIFVLCWPFMAVPMPVTAISAVAWFFLWGFYAWASWRIANRAWFRPDSPMILSESNSS